ncbi:alpha/beta-tubulin-N-acetyltransferase 9 isoform X8 [Callithrix jacchus]|uniref:alpha/beta-tubulin-N-acetyltransferase 9 isoform X7 n=1 Tax=Callithrix jacchus TaxID=9483 RepID=UPI0008407BFC|nr:alpha/beta-tubulin-N-acetyltransferase 9 isoform X7 [Callithrix jacchus]
MREPSLGAWQVGGGGSPLLQWTLLSAVGIDILRSGRKEPAKTESILGSLGYHEWMKSEELQRLTASEPLSLEQEYAMQRSWREDADKCTFIVLDAEKWQAQPGTTEESCMVGDVNLFLTDLEDPTLGEIEVMIAEPSFRGKGLGTEAVLMMLSYGVTRLDLTKFEAKIGQGNEPSIRMFQKLHFEQVAVSSVFQEVTLRLTISESEHEWLLEQTSHVEEKPYRDGSAEPC